VAITEDDLDDALTVDNAAAFLHVSTSTINRMIAARELSVIRIGSGRGRVRVTRRALLDAVERKSRSA
jgi:excisionase family DNA binding protein